MAFRDIGNREEKQEIRVSFFFFEFLFALLQIWIAEVNQRSSSRVNEDPKRREENKNPTKPEGFQIVEPGAGGQGKGLRYARIILSSYSSTQKQTKKEDI